MRQFEDFRTFVEIVDTGGVARAAGALNIAKSAVSRRLKLMEERYLVQLIDRRPGVWEVTPAGQEFYHRARVVLTEVEEIEADFSEQRLSLAGPLSISLPRDLGLDFLQPQLLAFAAEHPEIKLSIDFDNRRVDLERENYDLAVRISGETDANLVAIPLGMARHRLYVGAEYAYTRKPPATVQDLAEHPLLHYGPARRAVWALETEAGRQEIAFQPALNSNSGRFLLSAVLAGHGIAILPDFVAENACRAGKIREILPGVQLQSRAITLVYAKTRRLNRRMRVFINTLKCPLTMVDT